MIPIVNFADYATGQIYARLEHGRWAWRDPDGFSYALRDPDSKAGLQAVAPDKFDPARARSFVPPNPAAEMAHTLGAWGEAEAGAAGP
jgi:hypothetical protein